MVPVIIPIILETVITIVAIYYCYKLYHDRAQYPIKQLSPIITLFQGVSFYFCQLTLIYFIYKTQFSKCAKVLECQDSNSLYFTASIIYLVSRGLCFSLTFAKSYRIIKAFREENICSGKFLIFICKSEYWLLGIATIYGLIGFLGLPLLSIYIKNIQKEHILQIYETNSVLVWINSLFEELSTFILAWKKVSPFRINDQLVTLTLNWQVIYMIWFSFNSILADSGSLLFVHISCWIRCFVMFRYQIYKPWVNREEHPTIYIGEELIGNLSIVISGPFNNYFQNNNYALKLFHNYLIYLDNVGGKVIMPDGLQMENITNFEIFELFQKLKNQLEEGEDHFQGYDKIFAIMTSNHVFYGYFQNARIEDLQNQLFAYFQEIYQCKFMKTKSYYQLRNIYRSNEAIQKIFEILNIPLNEFKPKFARSLDIVMN